MKSMKEKEKHDDEDEDGRTLISESFRVTCHVPVTLQGKECIRHVLCPQGAFALRPKGKAKQENAQKAS